MDAIVNAATKRKRKLTALPLLILLFVISYFLLTKLVIEQDKMIDSQLSLIHTLFKDNVYLNTLHKHAGEGAKKVKTRGDGRSQAGVAASQNPASGSSLAQISSAQAPLTQIPVRQVPSSKV